MRNHAESYIIIHNRHTYICIYIYVYITLHYITLHYITLHYITLHYITLHYITLHYITLHYITLHYITLHYITLHYTHRYKYRGHEHENEKNKMNTPNTKPEWVIVAFLRWKGSVCWHRCSNQTHVWICLGCNFWRVFRSSIWIVLVGCCFLRV